MTRMGGAQKSILGVCDKQVGKGPIRLEGDCPDRVSDRLIMTTIPTSVLPKSRTALASLPRRMGQSAHVYGPYTLPPAVVFCG
jgi:hypothetical protein